MRRSNIISFPKIHANKSFAQNVIKLLESGDTVLAVTAMSDEITHFDVYTYKRRRHRVEHMTFHIEWVYDSTARKYTPDLFCWEEWLPDGTYIDDWSWKSYCPESFYADLDSLTDGKDWYRGLTSLDLDFDPEEQVLALAKQWHKEKHSVIRNFLHIFKQ